MKPHLDNEAGTALVMSLMVLVVVSILGAAVYSVTRATVRESVYQKRLAQAQSIAEAGLEDTLLQLRLNPNWRAGFTMKTFAGGSYTVTLSTDTAPWITSRGVSAPIAIFGPARAVVRVQTQITRGSSDCTTFSNSDTTIDGYVDAYDSSVSTNPASFSFGGHFCSNGGFKVKDHSEVSVRMDVDYYATPAPKASTIEGTVTRSTFTRVLPLRDGAPYVTNNDNGKLPPAYYTPSSKRLSIPSNVSVTVSSGTYYLNTLIVNGNLKANTSAGPVVIYLNGNFTLSNLSGAGNGEITNLSGIPSRLALYPQGSRTITLRSKAPLYTVVDGRSSNLVLSQIVYGNLVGNKITLNDGYFLHYDLQTSTGSVAASRVCWQPGSWFAQ